MPISLRTVRIPDFGVPLERPAIPAAIYEVARVAHAEGARRDRLARRLCRPRASRQHRLPHRLRAALRGGPAAARHGRTARPGRRQRERELRAARRPARHRGRALPDAEPDGTGPRRAGPISPTCCGEIGLAQGRHDRPRRLEISRTRGVATDRCRPSRRRPSSSTRCAPSSAIRRRSATRRRS